MILLILFVTFFKIGLFTIGGGYAMIPMILQDVESHGWMTPTELTDFIAIAESTPGPFAINIATFIGASQAGFVGAAIATLGVVLPSFLIILLAARWFLHFQDNPNVQGMLYGVRPAVVGLIGAAALGLISNGIFYEFPMEQLFTAFRQLRADWQNLFIFTVVLGISFLFKKLHPIFLIFIAGTLGVVTTLILGA